MIFLPLISDKKIGLFSILICFLIMTGCSSHVPVPEKTSADKREMLSKKEIDALISQPPFVKNPLKAEYSPIPEKKPEMATAGDTTPLGVKVTPELEFAFNSYLGGDGDKALNGLDRLMTKSSDSAVLWQASFLKAQILLMMGKASEAEEELERTTHLEIAHFGSDLNALALKGEVKIWLEDYDNALIDFARIIKETGAWELPISYMSFPTNREDLYYLTTAKLRAYTGIAGVYVFKDDMLSARAWAAEAERLYNNAHFVMNHFLYGLDEVHADSYYGRAMNLTFLAAANLGISRDVAAAEKMFAKADGFYNALGYSVGQVTVAAIKARTFNRLGMHDLCYSAGQYAIQLALSKGLPDYVWRIGVLTGITLLEYNQVDKAELAFRQAQNSVDAISGNLNSDKAKVRFGVGKNDIIYNLSHIDIRKKNWSALFTDLERARARAFVDLLANQAITRNRQAGLMTEIKSLEQQIVRQKLINMAPGMFDIKGIENEKKLMAVHREKVKLLQQKDPEMADLISIRYAALKDVQKQLQPGDAMAYAIPGKPGESIRFFMIYPNRTEIRQLSVKYRDIKPIMAQFASSFGLSDEDEDEDEEEESENRGIKLTRTQADVEEMEPEDVLAKLNQAFDINSWNIKNRLYIVPSGDLYFLPWGALKSDVPVISLPTGSWITRKSQNHNHKNHIVIVGDPAFGGELPQLPGAKKEAQMVGKIYKQTPIIGEQALEQKLRAQVGKGTDIIHLATHGIYDSRSPLKSAIYLTKEGKASPLTAAQIYENPLPARLVILSACETGLGKTIAGDDLLGLTRSFYLGGAISTLSSLWQIDDEGTMEFMKVFHEKAKNGHYGKAWLAARDVVKKKGYPASVYGAFVLSGAAQ